MLISDSSLNVDRTSLVSLSSASGLLRSRNVQPESSVAVVSDPATMSRPAWDSMSTWGICCVSCQQAEPLLGIITARVEDQLTQSSCFISSPSIRSWRTLPSSMRLATLLCVKTSCCSCDAIRLLGTIFRSSLVMVG